MKTSSTIAESVAKVLIVNKLNEVLILTVGEYKERPDKSFKPDLPGGIVELDESERDAVLREAEEETSIKLQLSETKLAYTETNFYPKENKSVSRFLYLAFLSTTPEVTISWEHRSYEWVPLEQLLQVELRPFYKEALGYCFMAKLL